MSVDLNILATVGKCMLYFMFSSIFLSAARSLKTLDYPFFLPPHLTFFPPLPLVLSMPSSNQGWPDEFGFQLGGTGPSYILSVEEGSSAHLAGLQAGDQVLEIEGHNVSTLGPQAVIAIAQTQKNIPPSIGVVSRIQQVGQPFFLIVSSAAAPSFILFSCACLFKKIPVRSDWSAPIGLRKHQ